MEQWSIACTCTDVFCVFIWGVEQAHIKRYEHTKTKAKASCDDHYHMDAASYLGMSSSPSDGSTFRVQHINTLQVRSATILIPGRQRHEPLRQRPHYATICRHKYYHLFISQLWSTAAATAAGRPAVADLGRHIQTCVHMGRMSTGQDGAMQCGLSPR